MPLLTSLGEFGLFALMVAWRSITPPIAVRDVTHHTWVVLSRCILPVVVVVFPFGMVMALQGLVIFNLFGAQRLLSALVGVAIFRELSPVLASVLVASQAGSAFAAQLGAMRVQEEIDATEVMAIDPIRVHVVPRVLAVVIATPMLNLFGSVAGVAGGFTTAVLVKGETAGVFWSNLWELTSMMDITSSLVKTAVFGLIIALIACYQGFYTRGGANGVGRAVNNTVVYSITIFVTANYFLTSAFFGGNS